MAKAPSNKAQALSIEMVRTGHTGFCILGKMPLIFHAMSEKAKRELLLPKEASSKTRAARAETEKHNPPEEFVESMYRFLDDGPDAEKPTRLYFPAGAFKNAMEGAALDIAGATKSEIMRLCWVEPFNVEIYGIPMLKMDVVRMANITRTPDIRTRAILRDWACRITVSYAEPKLTPQHVGNLLGNAGLLQGIGDGRQEKGAFNFGQFEPVSEADPRFQAVLKHGGRAAQDKAIAAMTPFDRESEKLLRYWREETERRGRTKVASTNGLGVAAAVDKAPTRGRRRQQPTATA
jgi:hypothetical protein